MGLRSWLLIIKDAKEVINPIKCFFDLGCQIDFISQHVIAEHVGGSMVRGGMLGNLKPFMDGSNYLKDES